MMETNTKVVEMHVDRRNKLIRTARGLSELLYAAATSAEFGDGFLGEDGITILANIAADIERRLLELTPLCGEGQDALNDVYEELDGLGRTDLLKYARELVSEKESVGV